MVDGGKAVVSELYNWSRDLLRLRVAEPVGGDMFAIDLFKKVHCSVSQ